MWMPSTLLAATATVSAAAAVCLAYDYPSYPSAWQTKSGGAWETKSDGGDEGSSDGSNLNASTSGGGTATLTDWISAAAARAGANDGTADPRPSSEAPSASGVNGRSNSSSGNSDDTRNQQVP